MLASLLVAMVETSPRLVEKQKQKLADTGVSVTWFERFADIPTGPLILVSNELFDAIPFRQFVKSNGRFVERLISLDENDEFHFVSGVGGIDPALLPKDHAQAPDGAIFEAAPARTALLQEIAQRIAKTRGAALNIDYGHLQSGFGDTLQAMLKHGYDDVFCSPGGRRPDQSCRFRYSGADSTRLALQDRHHDPRRIPAGHGPARPRRSSG
ncbi:putative s-adenosyl-L-methionine-dependent methyltransferase domain-containing protein [Ditylenchus destructor]|nr:putative s-adenosyl-L-methionine-dependent methyltransferase domain-containing protein [Ditylenchus destructor]